MKIKIFTSFLFLFCSTCTSKVIKIDKYTPKKSDKTLSSSQLIQTGIGYGVSAPITGAAYTMDGVIYLVGGTAVVIASCWPIFLTTSAPKNNMTPSPCLPYTGKLFLILENYHPKLGKNTWQATAHWRKTDP